MVALNPRIVPVFGTAVTCSPHTFLASSFVSCLEDPCPAVKSQSRLQHMPNLSNHNDPAYCTPRENISRTVHNTTQSPSTCRCRKAQLRILTPNLKSMLNNDLVPYSIRENAGLSGIDYPRGWFLEAFYSWVTQTSGGDRQPDQCSSASSYSARANVDMCTS